MSVSQGPALGAVAFQLAATLDAYERDVAMLVGVPFNPEAYRRVSGQMDEMRMYSASLPGLSVAWVEVMIRHFELTHGLWRLQKEGRAVADLRELHARLRDAVQRLSRKCVQLMPSA